ncbi:MAG: polysaccharide deacetylase family protein [Planctomycetes bacterium]|nr:polysaccharide deacetylase family protein [Planctomycetota bacterium]
MTRAPWADRLLEDGVAIFLFHGVLSRPRPGVRNYTGKHLVLDEFVRVIEELLASGSPISMPRLAAARKGDRLPPRAFAITFDDGFENNRMVAAPVLAAHGVPATFYVTTGFIESNGASWIDRIEYAVGRVPGAHLSLPSSGIEGAFAGDVEKKDLLDRIRRAVKADRSIDPYAFADEVWRQLRVEEMAPDPELDRKMDWAGVRELAANPLFTIGGHGHTHRILEFLPDEELERELDASFRLLTSNLGRPPEHYSYPEGLAHCYSDRVIAALARRGVVSCPTAEDGTNRPGDDPFRLKRIAVLPRGA